MIHFLAALALAGHFFFWIGAVNRVHAIAKRRSVLDAFDAFWYCVLFGMPALLAWHYVFPDSLVRATDAGPWRFLSTLPPAPNPPPAGPIDWALYLYACGCLASAAVAIPCWARQRLFRRMSPALLDRRTTRIDLTEAAGRLSTGNWAIRLMASLPGNQVCSLDVEEKTVRVPRLDRRLDGLKIVHISDLHLSDRLGPAFYDRVVDEVNRADADLVAVTGDILERPDCLAWAPDVLGRIAGRCGTYFVLGNHDHRAGPIPQVRATLTGAGLVDLGGAHLKLSVRDCPVLLVGNEWPWGSPRPAVPVAESANTTPRPLRVLLAHTPDEIGWARSHGFDLMLAGHTHGGQIRPPLLGPTICPSRFGVRYISGVFFEPPTLLHVTRGVSGTRPLRFNCPPEVSVLTLRGDP